jgi:hypothetical protein
MILSLVLILWILDDVNLHFVSGFMILNMYVTVKYRLVCLYVVWCRDWTVLDWLNIFSMHIILLQYTLFKSQHLKYVMPDLAIDSNIANCRHIFLK